MNTKIIIEAVGYCGSLLVLVSFLMTSVVKLRVVNTIGSAIFAIYALIIHSYPTAIMNICLVAINLH
ncbi:MAG: YgjV family protein, partial [Oscillospiraceae bacterium]|nr:YgjV family protein [Oscillospiraceae bacterium]